jgi:hypothetical protein
MADREACEGSDGRLAVGQRVAGIAEREIVEERQARVARRRPDQGLSPGLLRKAHQRAAQLSGVVAAEIAVEEEGGQQEQA